MQRLPNRLVFVLATVLVLGSHGQSSAIVLCVGVDGHVEVEQAVDGNCAADTDPHTAALADHASACDMQHDEDHCGACIDIPIDVGAFDRCHPLLPAPSTDHAKVKPFSANATLYALVPANPSHRSGLDATTPLSFANDGRFATTVLRI